MGVRRVRVTRVRGVTRLRTTCDAAWTHLVSGFERIVAEVSAPEEQRTAACTWERSAAGNHFVEVCLDESQAVWFMLH